jgi:hypothetical protein
MAMILTTLVNHWYGGRPLREHTRAFGFISDLDQYREDYALLGQSAIWSSVKRKDFRALEVALWLSMLLVPRWRGRLRAILPPTLTSRLSNNRR